MKFKLTLIAIILLSLFCVKRPLIKDAWFDRPLFNLNDTIPMNPEIIYGKFDNGFKYIIQKNQKPVKRAELRLIVDSGSILENDVQKGLAHFCEHMAFNGTKHFEKQALIDYLESIGMRFGPEINAYTGFDETVYMLEVPTDSLEILETAFQILEDWAHLVNYNNDEINKERSVILEEWRSGRGAAARIWDKQLPVLLYHSKYADRLPIGDPAVVDTAHADLIRQFYKDWYRPDLMSLVAVGDFDPDWVREKIKNHFAQIQLPETERQRTQISVPDHIDTKVSIVTDPEAVFNRIGLYYKYDLPSNVTNYDYLRSLIEYIYDNMMNNRLSELLRIENPPFLFASSGGSALTRNKGSYTLEAVVADNDMIRGLSALLKEARRVKEFGFTLSELDRAKLEMLRFIEKAYQEKDKTESIRYASEYVRHFTDKEPIPGIVYEYQFFQEFIPKIRLDEVNALNNQWMKKSSLVILASGPEKEGVKLPDEITLLNTFNEVNSMTIEPYDDTVSNEPLVSIVPVPGQISVASRIDTLGITEWKLSNGVTVLLKPTNFKNDQVLFRAYSLGGSSLAPDSISVAAFTASSIILNSGVGTFDLNALQKKMAAKIVDVNPRIDGLTEGMTGMCSPKDMETMFQLIYLYFTAPRIDSTAYLSYIEKIQGLIENRNVRPESAYNDTIQVIMAQHHPRMRPWSNELLNEMNLRASYQFYMNRFADASDFNFYFIGNFTESQIEPYVLTYLASLPDIDRIETFKDLGIDPPSGHIEKTVFKGIEPKSRVTLVFTGPIMWETKVNHRFDSMIDLLNIKLRESIREDLGGTYGVDVSGAVYKYPKERYDIRISFGCDPDRVDELTNAVFMQIDTLCLQGPRRKDLQKVKETQLRSYEINLEKNEYWLNALYLADFYKIDPLNILYYPELVGSVTLNDIQEMTKHCFNMNNYIRFVLYPENRE